MCENMLWLIRLPADFSNKTYKRKYLEDKVRIYENVIHKITLELKTLEQKLDQLELERDKYGLTNMENKDI